MQYSYFFSILNCKYIYIVAILMLFYVTWTDERIKSLLIYEICILEREH